ncbi:hypothetical protein LC040_02940 [Bacillus tianshenii]|nr:hypothetical protein LC040_02940 [Bacillus tianshenii]
MAILKRKKLLFIILIMILFSLSMTRCSKTSTDIEDYLNTGTNLDRHAKDMMPTLDELPEYENIEYRHTRKTMLMFQANSVALIVKYEDKTYESETERLTENYTFLNEKRYSMPEYEFPVNSYTFNVVKGNEKSYTHFPKSFGMIGTSDEKKKYCIFIFL